MTEDLDDKGFFRRYWWIFGGALGAVVLASALNISNTDGWIVVTNSSNESFTLNWNTTKPTVCATGNYSYWTGTAFLCSPDTTGSASGSDGNNYTTGIAFTGTTTKLLTLNRLGMTDLTASFTDLFQNFTSEINSLNSTKVPYSGATGNVTLGSYSLLAHSVKPDGSDGLLIQAANNLNVASFGVGNTNNSLFYGSVSLFNGQNLCLGSDCRSVWPTSGGGSSFSPMATNYYYKSYDFESVTAGIMDPWAPAAISSGTTALIAGEYNRPGLATVSSSTTASSGYSYQVTGATTYLLGNGSGSVVMIAPIPKTGNLTTCKLGFQDVFTIAASVDGAFWNATQNSSTTFNWTPVMRTNNVEVRGSMNTFAANTNQYYKAEVYVINTTQIQYTLYNSSGTGTVLSQQLLNGTVPSVAGRETSHAAVCFVAGGTTAQVLARLDYLGVYNNATVFNR